MDLLWETAELNTNIKFDMLYDHKLGNSTVTVDGEGSVIRIDYPNRQDNDIIVYNELQQAQLFHLSHMYWKVPSEHSINNR